MPWGSLPFMKAHDMPPLSKSAGGFGTFKSPGTQKLPTKAPFLSLPLFNPVQKSLYAYAQSEPGADLFSQSHEPHARLSCLAPGMGGTVKAGDAGFTVSFPVWKKATLSLRGPVSDMSGAPLT